MKKVVLISVLVFVLVLMEGVAWRIYTSSPSKNTDEPAKPREQTQGSLLSSGSANKAEEKSDSEDFPSPSTEVVNGVTERTIHIGVRQWAWDPSTLTAKKGELVRLIVHNADVKHGLVIPDLGVNEDIPEDGAVVEFTASQVGTFEFFCSVWCGEGHMEMRGKIIIE
jgi:cytochrome c oxidase subunit 2